MKIKFFICLENFHLDFFNTNEIEVYNFQGKRFAILELQENDFMPKIGDIIKIGTQQKSIKTIERNYDLLNKELRILALFD